MTPFRDEQVALLERVARLEDELREARQANQPPPEKPPEPAAAKPAEAAPSPRLVFGLLAGAALLVVGVGYMSRHEEPKVTKPTDPTSISEARAVATKAGYPATGQLVKMKAWYVSADGLLHAHPAYSPKVEFVFAAPRAPEPASSVPRPIGAPEDPMKMFRNEYTVSLSPSDVHVEEQTFMMAMQGPVADPHCRLVDVWKAAESAGAPAEAVAVIEYAEGFVDSRSIRGNMSRVPRWHFTISSTPPFSVDISDSDCSVMR